MKTHLLKITLLIFCMIGMISCGCMKHKGKVPKDLLDNSHKSRSAVQMQYDYLSENKSKFGNNFSTLTNGTSVLKYDSDNIMIGNDFEIIDGDIDDTDVVFKLDELEAYICYIYNEFEPLLKKEPYKNYDPDSLGVRIYFGAKKNSLDTLYPDELRTTVFLVPVIKTDRVPDEYIDIREIAPLNFGHARRPPSLYKGYTGVRIY